MCSQRLAHLSEKGPYVMSVSGHKASALLTNDGQVVMFGKYCYVLETTKDSNVELIKGLVHYLAQLYLKVIGIECIFFKLSSLFCTCIFSLRTSDKCLAKCLHSEKIIDIEA